MRGTSIGALVASLALCAGATAQGDKKLEVSAPKVNKDKDTVAKFNVYRKEGNDSILYKMDVTIPKGETWTAAKKAEELVKALKKDYGSKKAPSRNMLGPSAAGSTITLKGGKSDNYIEKISLFEDTTGEVDKAKLKDGNLPLSLNDFDFRIPGTTVCSGTTTDADGNVVPGSLLTLGVESLSFTWVSSLTPSAGLSGEDLLDAMYADLLANAPLGMASALIYDDPGDQIRFNFGSLLEHAELEEWAMAAGFDDLDAGAAMSWDLNYRTVVPSPAGAAVGVIAVIAALRRRR